jgi:hypothetical protein
MGVTEIPLAHTPPGGWNEMPPPILAGCDEPLVAGAPDLRGMWRVVAVETELAATETSASLLDRIRRHTERIEQAGNRICVTSDGIIHDMYADGTVENGVNDVSPNGMPISVVCTYEDGVHVLRPVGMDGIEVTRRLDGDQLVWTYGPMFTARLERMP